MLNELNNLLLNLKERFIEIAPNLLTSILVIAIGYLLARLVKYLVQRIIQYLDRIISNNFRKVDLTKAASFIGMAFFWLIIFCTILLVTDILGLTILTGWFENILEYVPNVLAAILIIFAAMIIGNFISGAIDSLTAQAGISYGNTLGKIAHYFILFTAIIIAIDQIGIEVSFLVHVIDIVLAGLLFGAALAFGLGAKTSISNILAAFYVRKTYKEGDEIQIGEIRGTIIKIDTRSVVLDSEMGIVTIPAKEFNENKSYLITKS